MKKILLVGTGGTIASVKDENIHLDNAFKILDYFDKNLFETVSPFVILSENMNAQFENQLIEFLKGVEFEKYLGVIILHGSDTLAFTANIIASVFENKNIILVASDKPVEESGSNALANFKVAVDQIQKELNEVYVSYDGLKKASEIISADSNDEFLTHKSGDFKSDKKYKNILVINPYIGIDYKNYDLKNVDLVLHTMYHSATVSAEAKEFYKKCENEKVDFYFITTKSKAEYESVNDLKNILFNMSVERAISIFGF